MFTVRVRIRVSITVPFEDVLLYFFIVIIFIIYLLGLYMTR